MWCEIPLGYRGGTYIVFLALLMTALSGKLIAMGLGGVIIVPAVIIIPVLNIVAIYFAGSLILSLGKTEVTGK